MTPEDEEFYRIEREAAMRKEAVKASVERTAETNISEYIQGFNDGYAYVLEQIERHPRLTTPEMARYLRGDRVEQGPSIRTARERDQECD